MMEDDAHVGAAFSADLVSQCRNLGMKCGISYYTLNVIYRRVHQMEQ